MSEPFTPAPIVGPSPDPFTGDMAENDREARSRFVRASATWFGEQMREHAAKQSAEKTPPSIFERVAESDRRYISQIGNCVADMASQVAGSNPAALNLFKRTE